MTKEELIKIQKAVAQEIMKEACAQHHPNKTKRLSELQVKLDAINRAGFYLTKE